MTPYDIAQTMSNALNLADVKTTSDPSRIVPPCVLITPPTVENDLNCGFTATWKTLIIVPANNARIAWQQLDSLAAKVLEIITDVTEIEPSSFAVAGDNALPCLVLTHESELDWKTS